MKRLYGILVLFLSYFTAVGQASFDQLPRDLQLYPRDANSQAQVVVSGKTTALGYTKIGMQTLREGKLTQVISQTLPATSSSASFTLTSTIKAEPAEYQFKIFLYKGTDSTLVANPQRVVSGDVYIIHGQSNALASAELDTYYSFDFDDKYLRNATYPFQSTNIPGEMKWYAAKQPYASVGGFGLTLQRLILQTYGIPTCVLNGAQGGTDIGTLSVRDAANHASLNNIYGRLLYRAQWAGVAKQVKGFIWKQGEEDAGSGIVGYGDKFTALYNQIREDYGNVRIYVGQIDILPTSPDNAAQLRDFQRRTKTLFKNVDALATVGTPGHQEDGIHYGAPSHQQLAFEQFRLIARDVYGSKDTLQINSPNIQRAFYNTKKDSITLVFDDQMQMVWKNDSTFYNFSDGSIQTVRRLKDYFYLDKQSGWVTGGVAKGNRVVLGLKQAATAKTIRYLPAFFSDANSKFYNGPTLKNARGMRAFTFDSVSIGDALAPVTTLAAKALSDKQIQLSWTIPGIAQSQILERSDGSTTAFKQLATLSGSATSYTDNTIANPLATYYYRLRVYSTASESTLSNVTNAKPLVLGLEPTLPVVQLYPNPLSTERLLHVEAEQVTFTDLTVRDLMGRIVKSWQGNARNSLTISLDALAAGLYLADIQTVNGQRLRRKIVIR
jgi:hypothetical protein